MVFIVPQVDFSWFQVSFYGSRLVFHGFHSFRLVFHGFSWFQVGFYGFSWFFMIFHGSRLVFHGFSPNILAPTVSWPDDPIQVCRPQGGIGPSMYNVHACTLIVFYEDHEHQVKECRMPGVPKKLKTTCLQQWRILCQKSLLKNDRGSIYVHVYDITFRVQSLQQNEFLEASLQFTLFSWWCEMNTLTRRLELLT